MWGLFDNIKTLPRIENRQRFCFFQCKISYLCNMGNTSDNQLILFHCPTIDKAGNRRRTRSLPRSGDGNITSRADRIAKRNRLLTARYYYWTELERRRFDDVLKILADNEFFVEDRTISNALVAEDEFYNKLIRQRTTKRQLRQMFPGFDWG